MKLGTENLELVADFAVDLAVQTVKTLADKKVSITEAGAFAFIGFKIPAVLCAFPNVVLEIKDLDEVEKDELVSHIAYRLRTEDLAAAEIVATKALNLLYALQELGASVKDIKRK